MPADPLVQVLPVAAGGDGRHQDVLGRHEGQLLGQVPGDHLRIDDQPGGDVLVQDQDRVDRQKRLRQRQPAVGAVVERPLQPLRGRASARRSIRRLITNRASPQIRSARIGFRL